MKKKLFRLFAVSVACFTLSQSIVFASEVIPETYEEVEIRAEETGYKYKYFDDILYKRLWSYTYGRWVDEHWSLA